MSSSEEMQQRKDERKEEVAQEKFGASFDELEGRERQSVAGTVGGEIRREQMAEATGGDVHQAYAEMGSKGGTHKSSEGQEQEKE